MRVGRGLRGHCSCSAAPKSAEAAAAAFSPLGCLPLKPNKLLVFIVENTGAETALNSGVLLSSCPKQTSRTLKKQSQAGCFSPPLRKSLPVGSQMQTTCALACSPSASQAGTEPGAPRTQTPQPRAAHTQVSARRGVGGGGGGQRRCPQQQLFCCPLHPPHTQHGAVLQEMEVLPAVSVQDRWWLVKAGTAPPPTLTDAPWLLVCTWGGPERGPQGDSLMQKRSR